MRVLVGCVCPFSAHVSVPQRFACGPETAQFFERLESQEVVLAIMSEGAGLAPVAHSKNQFPSHTKIRVTWLHNVGVLQRNVVWDLSLLEMR